jgi:hypothetical protein
VEPRVFYERAAVEHDDVRHAAALASISAAVITGVPKS